MKIKEMLYERITRLEMLGCILAFSFGLVVGQILWKWM